METIIDAKRYLRENWEIGVKCPCCGQRVQKYKFKFNSGMARLLIEFRKQDDWIHVTNHFRRLGLNAHAMNYGKLKFWKLIEKQKKEPTLDKNSNGYWKITHIGKDFVDQKVSIPTHAYFFDNKVIGYSSNELNITEALGKHFSYYELMYGGDR